ncbi:MAG TPA: phosphoribosyltransferase [Ktedonobacteraceae bacterium]|nr:phosphoribosyltransferase [Ktedonobacteraceae bacterium]
MLTQFHDRKEAGKLLAAQLTGYANKQDVIVLALPRGGVPVGFEIAKALHVPLDIIVVRKLGVPGQEELAMGAIATGGVRILNKDVVQYLDIPSNMIDKIAANEQQELERRERLYRGDRPAYAVQGRTVILVDDGIATGATMHAAVAAIKQRQPARIIIAVPTAAPSTCDEFALEVDELVCVLRPEPFIAVSYWYRQFSQTSDEDVRRLLERANHETSTIQSRPQNTPTTLTDKNNTGKDTSQAARWR